MVIPRASAPRSSRGVEKQRSGGGLRGLRRKAAYANETLPHDSSSSSSAETSSQLEMPQARLTTEQQMESTSQGLLPRPKKQIMHTPMIAWGPASTTDSTNLNRSYECVTLPASHDSQASITTRTCSSDRRARLRGCGRGTFASLAA